MQEPVLLPDGKYELPPRGLEGPWEEVSEDQAYAKAIQVMRDSKAKAPTSSGAVSQETIDVDEKIAELSGMEDVAQV